jgi:membrane protease YdiL (CAAX protease family)
MTHPPKNPAYRQIDAWLAVVGSFLLHALISYVLFPKLQTVFPQVSESTIWYISTIPIDLLPIIYLYFRCGPIGISDFSLKWMDFAVTLISLCILAIAFSAVSLMVGYESIVPYQEISRINGFEYLVTVFILFLTGPFLEEILFRKYIYEIFRNRYGSLIAFFAVATVETLTHIGYWNIGTLIVIFFSLMFLTLVYVKTRLGASIIVHCIINIVMVCG